MSLIRRISLAATAATAALACAIPSSASAISISGGEYDMRAVWTYFFMGGWGSNEFGVACNQIGHFPHGYGRGLALGQASTLFVPPFVKPADYGTWGECYSSSSHQGSVDTTLVRVDMAGAFKLTLASLKPSQNPSSSSRSYSGTLSLPSPSRLEFRLERFPGCTVTVAGPQSVEVGGTEGYIEVYDDWDVLNLDLTAVELATTKTTACPSVIEDTVTIWPASGWDFRGVTVTH